MRKIELDINELTIGQAKELANLFGNKNQEQTASKHVGKKCIIRSYASGVHFGTLTENSGRKVELKNARRLWRWDTGGEGISLSEISHAGLNHSESRVCINVPEQTILDALEIIPCTDVAIDNIESAEVYKP